MNVTSLLFMHNNERKLFMQDSQFINVPMDFHQTPEPTKRWLFFFSKENGVRVSTKEHS